MTEYKNVVAEDGYIEIEFFDLDKKWRCHFCNKMMDVGTPVVRDEYRGGWTEHIPCWERRKKRDSRLKWNMGNPIVNGHTQ